MVSYNREYAGNLLNHFSIGHITNESTTFPREKGE